MITVSKMDFEGRRWTEVNPQAEPLLNPQTGEVVSEPYEKNPDVKLEFGVLDGKVVIRRIETPNFYPQEQTSEMADYGRKNIGNCSICDKHKHFLSDLKKSLPLKVERSFDTWVVDIRPDEDIRVRKILTNKDDEKDVAVGVGLDKDKQVVAKKVAFPIEKYSKEDALKLADDYRREAIEHVEKLKQGVKDRARPRPMPSRQQVEVKRAEPKPSTARVNVGIFPNFAEWRRERKKIMD